MLNCKLQSVTLRHVILPDGRPGPLPHYSSICSRQGRGESKPLVEALMIIYCVKRRKGQIKERYL